MNRAIALGYEPEFGDYKRIVQYVQYVTGTLFQSDRC